MARSADFDLAAALAKPSFTPSQRDAPALVELIVKGDEPAASRAAPALAKLGSAARLAILARVDAPDAATPKTPWAKGGPAQLDDGGAARLVGALGLLARAGDADARTDVIARATDPRVRVRRAAIGALGKLGGDDARAAVIARWDAADVPADERRVLAEALGKLGGSEAMARLEAADTRDDSELARRRDRALVMADRESKRDTESTIAIEVAPPKPVTVRLGCRPGLGALLVEELTALGIKAKPIASDGAEVTLAGPWSMLFASRLWATAAIPLPFDNGTHRRGKKADRVEDPERLGAAIVKAMLSPDTRALLAAWTVGPIRWRLGFAKGHKRAIVWRVARDVTAAAPELINDPTATTWDVVVDDEAGTLALMPRRLADPRWAWRVAEVPAASHPTVAAALAFAASVRSGETSWDPFCGSGLELIECARRGATVYGSDLDEAALVAARANCDAANIDARLVRADARVYSCHPVDAIVTNPPLGSRVQLDAAAVLAETVSNLARQLAPGGRLVWITPSPRKTTPAAEAEGLQRNLALPVDLGGVRGQLERWDKPLRG